MERDQWQPAPVQTQSPGAQLENEQLAPGAHAMTQPPPEQATVQVAPLGHDVLQWPVEHGSARDESVDSHSYPSFGLKEGRRAWSREARSPRPLVHAPHRQLSGDKRSPGGTWARGMAPASVERMHEEAKCSNPSCRCKVPKERAALGDPYCSEYCAENAGEKGRPTQACGCGHAACEGDG